MNCPSCRCDVKSWFISGFVIAVLYLGMDMFFHHYCMGKMYQANFHFFRSMDEMTALRWYGYLGYLVFGLLFVCIYSKGYEEGKSKAGQGLRFGLLMGLFYWGANLLISFPHMPWPKKLYAGWFAIGMVEFVVLGFILGFIFKPKANA